MGEMENSAAALNDAELGMANLRQAMRDPSLLADVASGLRHPEGRAELIKMLANPSFQQQVKSIIEANGVVADLLTPEFYAKEQQKTGSLANLLFALRPTSARASSARRNVRMETV